MSKTITLQDIKITYWTVNVTLRNVTVAYQVIQDDTDVYQEGEAILWETIPPERIETDGTPIPNPDNWYQLPAKYSQMLTDLTMDARGALLHIINE